MEFLVVVLITSGVSLIMLLGTAEINKRSKSVMAFEKSCYRLDNIVTNTIRNNCISKDTKLITTLSHIISKCKLDRNGLLYINLENQFFERLLPIINLDSNLNEGQIRMIFYQVEIELEKDKDTIQQLSSW